MEEKEKQEAGQAEGKALTALTAEEQDIERWYNRMRRYHITLPDPVRYMAARMAVAYGLDPFLGEMVFIPQYKDRKVVGYQPYVGIGGLRRAARRTGEYNGRELRPCTEEERNALQIDEDVHAWLCKIWRKGIDRPFDGFGVFPLNDRDKKSTAPHWRMARKRAEHAALRAAFDLELQLMEGNGLVVEVEPIEAEVVSVEIPGQPEALTVFVDPSEEEPSPPTVEEGIAPESKEPEQSLEEATQQAEEIIQQGLEKQGEPLDLKAAITTGHTEGLWAYAEAKGIDIGIVKEVLEQTGGEVEETLTRLKEEYGEVE